MEKPRKLVGTVDVGERRSMLTEKHTISIAFHDFENLAHSPTNCTESPPVLCHGHLWSVRLYPGGTDESREGRVSLYLKLHRKEKNTREVHTKFTMRVPSAGEELTTSHKFESRSTSWGYPTYADRVDVLDPSKGYLQDGTLTIEVDIQIYVNHPIAWIPKCKLQQDMLRMLKSGKNYDITFSVGQVKVPAHCLILENRAPSLAALAEEFSPNEEIPIEGVEPSIFQILLRFVYANKLPPSPELRQEAPAILEVADRFACTDLKIIAESELDVSGFTAETTADLLLYADAHCCARLREATVDFFVSNPSAVMASEGWTRLSESAAILAELMEILVDRKKLISEQNNSSEGDSNNIDNMHVLALWHELEEKDLDIDGSREMLIERLKKSSSTSSS